MVAFTLEESARRLGQFRWLEMRLFELLGRWVADTVDHETKLRYVSASRHHGWHAQLLEDRLPEVRELSPARQTVPPSPELASILDELAGLAGPDRELERAVAVHGVIVPLLIDAYDAHLERCTPVADASVIRTIGFILADERGDVSDAERSLASMTAAPEAAAIADGVRSRIGAELARSGGIPTV